MTCLIKYLRGDESPMKTFVNIADHIDSRHNHYISHDGASRIFMNYFLELIKKSLNSYISDSKKANNQVFTSRLSTLVKLGMQLYNKEQSRDAVMG